MTSAPAATRQPGPSTARGPTVGAVGDLGAGADEQARARSARTRVSTRPSRMSQLACR